MAQTDKIHNLNVGDTIDLAYRVEMSETDQDGFGFVPLRANKMQKFSTGHTGYSGFSKLIMKKVLD